MIENNPIKSDSILKYIFIFKEYVEYEMRVFKFEFRLDVQLQI
jgi:hypothetical protein